MHKHSLDDLTTLFTLRFIFDDPSDIVDLRQDVKDLQEFPERLRGSYISEWKSYVRRHMYRQNLKLMSLDLYQLMENLEQEKLIEFQLLTSIIEQANLITQSEKVKVIKSPFKAYIESLLKI